jgi:serine phosphatase RsbU (regulator of sigma subunit)
MKNENAIEPIKINSNGGKIFIYTDGVTEGYINTNKQELGASGVEQIIKTNYQSSLKEIIDQIVSVLTISQQDRRDDITCLGINIKS